MANNTLIGVTNLLATATLKNGTGGGAPAREETSPYVMENLKGSDRSTVWQTSLAPPSPTQIDFDLGSNKTVTAVGMLGYREATGVVNTMLKVYSAASASGYVPGVWTLQATIVNIGDSTRDVGAIIASVSHRYWRFEFPLPTGQFSVGRFWIGNPTDLGLYHSPGALFSRYQNRLETPQPNGSIVIAPLGDPGMDIVLPFNYATSALKTTLAALVDQPGSFLLIDPDANFYEVILKQGRVPVTRNFNSAYSITLEMQRLP
jgi:hypothetical protein